MPDQTDLYDDSPESAAEGEPQSESGDSSTSILPKQFFQGKDLQPGGRCEVEIKRVHDDSVEVAYVPESSTEATVPEEEAMPMESGMAQYME